jgi:hypothetical protein
MPHFFHCLLHESFLLEPGASYRTHPDNLQSLSPEHGLGKRVNLVFFAVGICSTKTRAGACVPPWVCAPSCDPWRSMLKSGLPRGFGRRCRFFVELRTTVKLRGQADTDKQGQKRVFETQIQVTLPNRPRGIPSSAGSSSPAVRSPLFFQAFPTMMGKFGEISKERGGRTTTLAAVAVLCAVVAKGVVLGGVGSQRSALVQFNPYGVLARTGGNDDYMGALAHTKGDSYPGGVLAHLESNAHQKLALMPKAALTADEKRAVFGSLSGFDKDENNVGGSLSAKGIGSDRSWSVRPAKSAAGTYELFHTCNDHHSQQRQKYSVTILLLQAFHHVFV